MKDFLGYKDEYLSTKRGYNLLRFISPLKCMFCGEVDFIDEGPFCPECHETFKELTNKPCHICGCSKEECTCYDIPGVKKHFFLFWYKEAFAKKIVSKAKYYGEKRYISFLAYLLSEKIKENRKRTVFSGICYVPRTKAAIRKSGYDQSLHLAECVSYYLGIPVYHCLSRTGSQEEQKKLSGVDRRKNIRRKFDVVLKEMVNQHGEIHKTILLIDDIVTTGSTVQECSRILRKHGVSSVHVASLSRTPFPKKWNVIKKTKKL